MDYTFKKLLYVKLLLLLSFVGYSQAATAQSLVLDGMIFVDAGTYAPVALGETITLDACDSSFHTAPLSNISVCNSPTIDNIFFEWTVTYNDGVDDVILYDPGLIAGANNPLGGQYLTLPTGGVGDLITAMGTYIVRLDIWPGIGPLSIAPDLGVRIVARGPADFTSFDVVAAASVPEPEALLILLLGLLYIMRRQRSTLKPNM